MPFKIIRQDITKLDVEAIVNAANTALQMGGGVCGAIFNAAGPTELQASCDKLAPINTGEAVITPGFALPAKYVIHTPGPIYQDYPPQESEALLRACYRNALNLAHDQGIKSIAFPVISSGIYSYPQNEALGVAVSTILSFLETHDMDVYLTIFGKPNRSRRLDRYDDISAFVVERFNRSDRIVKERQFRKKIDREYPTIPAFQLSYVTYQAKPVDQAKELEDQLKKLEDSFATRLFHLIDSKGKTDVEVYKRANMDRKLFSKIRTSKHYLPSKKNIIALAIALELDLDQTQDLLNRAGYALSNSQFFDIIIEYFIVNRIFDIYDINEVLYSYDLPLLGA